uniref:Thiamine-phosphate synthase n=1 Tax=candidate division WOR-3 bacterium TaxID=2052148 RepID=A0A7V0Z5J4_UNCW3
MQWERILDVNLNRLTESLKLIEDYARFVMEDLSILENIRKLRKSFLNIKKSLPVKNFILYRHSETDLGREPEFDVIPRQAEDDILLANFSRAKESARIIEEILRQKNKIMSRNIKKIRFQIYDLEKLVLQKHKKRFDPRLYVIIDEKYIDKMPLYEMIKILQDNGVSMIQLRIKTMSDRRFYYYGKRIRTLITNKELKFIINNRIDIALAVNADGIHLGQEDIPLNYARDILGENFIIGVSAHNLKEALRAQKNGADYLGVGAVFPTKTKQDAQVCGLDLIRKLKNKINIPIIAIGGINNRNYKKVLKAGADGIAIASYLFEGDLKENLWSLTKKA